MSYMYILSEYMKLYLVLCTTWCNVSTVCSVLNLQLPVLFWLTPRNKIAC